MNKDSDALLNLLGGNSCWGVGGGGAISATAAVSIRVGGRSGLLPSRTGIRQGCAMSPTLSGLLADVIHNFRQGNMVVSEGVPLGLVLSM